MSENHDPGIPRSLYLKVYRDSDSELLLDTEYDSIERVKVPTSEVKCKKVNIQTSSTGIRFIDTIRFWFKGEEVCWFEVIVYEIAGYLISVQYAYNGERVNFTISEGKS